MGEDPRQATPPVRDKHRYLPLLERFALVALLLGLIVFFSVDSTTGTIFRSGANIRNLLSGQAVVALAALAALVPLTANEFDVSVGAILGATSFACASAVSHGWPLAGAVVLAIALGAAIGLFNGILVAYVRVISFMITLASGTLVTGLTLLYAHEQILSANISQSLVNFGATNFLGVPKVVWVVALAAIMLWFVLNHTLFGRYLYAIGANARGAQLVGMPVQRTVVAAFVVSGACAGLGGVVLLAGTGSADPNIGPGYTLGALSAGFLGATVLHPGRFDVPGTLVGLAFIAVSVNGLTLAGASGWVDPVFNGASLILALTLSSFLSRYRVGERR
jgi:ribose transport system permease protein